MNELLYATDVRSHARVLESYPTRSLFDDLTVSAGARINDSLSRTHRNRDADDATITSTASGRQLDPYSTDGSIASLDTVSCRPTVNRRLLLRGMILGAFLCNIEFDVLVYSASGFVYLAC